MILTSVAILMCAYLVGFFIKPAPTATTEEEAGDKQILTGGPGGGGMRGGGRGQPGE